MRDATTSLFLSENRKEKITLEGGIENFETNLEMLALKHEYAYI